MKLIKEKVEVLMNSIRQQSPLVHHITNYVTVNDCANVTLGIGASPVMADEIEEVRDIVRISSSLVLNIGTLNKRTVKSSMIAGKEAKKYSIPIIVDPVGAGASRLRTNVALKMIDNLSLAVLKGNISEIKCLFGGEAKTKGVDASADDERGLEERAIIAKSFALKKNCIVAMTGAIDVVSDGSRVVGIKNGCSNLSGITGTGCMCSSLIGSFCGVGRQNNYFEATIAGLLVMSIAGEMANKAINNKGSGSFHQALHDAISTMNSVIIMEKAQVYEIGY